METAIRTAVTVRASRKADKNAAEIMNSKDRAILFFTVSRSFVNITKRRSFIKKIAETIKISSKSTSRFDSIS